MDQLNKRSKMILSQIFPTNPKNIVLKSIITIRSSFFSLSFLMFIYIFLKFKRFFKIYQITKRFKPLVNRRNYMLLESVISTAMMASFSLICKKFSLKFLDNRTKQSIITKLDQYENDLIMYNHQYGIMKEFIRNHGKEPRESLEMASEFNNHYIFKVNNENYDEYLKKLTVKAIKKNGETNIVEFLVPIHEDVAKNDSFHLEMLDPELMDSSYEKM